MENLVTICLVVAFLFLLFKFVEMRFIEKENKPIKTIIKDSLIVFISVFVGIMAIKQFPNVTEEASASVFTNKPDF